ncbi:hypothetical protein ScPMuIL_014586 [Solemya velum]
MNGNIISEGDYVVLKKEKNIKVFRVHRQRDVFMDKVRFTLDAAVGHPYGTMFEVKNGKLLKLERISLTEEEVTKKVAGVDNRDLHDLDSNQMLSQDDIEEMKKSGESRERIIEQIVEHSVTFEKKTEYAQAKYIKKKKLKHLMEFRIVKPNARHLCEMYFNKSPAKICHLRGDSLGQILTYGNVKSGMTVGLVDSCQGLVIGAVLERMQGSGKVVSFHPGSGSTTPRPILDMYDFPPDVTEMLHNFPLQQINSFRLETRSSQPVSGSVQQVHSVSDTSIPETGTMVDENTIGDKTMVPNTNEHNATALDNDDAEINTKTELNDSKDAEGAPDDACGLRQDSTVSDTTMDDSGPLSNLDNKRKRKNRKAGGKSEAEHIEDTKKVLLENKLDCLIIASKFHPTPIVMALIDFLAPSRPLVVYSQYKEPLMDCYTQVREKGGFINFHLTETWLRQYQVLPQRTHPVIQMCGASGYLFVCCSIKQT